MALRFTRCPENPIVIPGLYEWRMSSVFNPGVLYDEGRFYMYERAAASLRPYHCYIGMLESDDGVHFTHVSDRPVFTPEMAGSRYGSVQDPRVVKIDGLCYMTFAYRPYAWSCNPTGLGVPESYESTFPGYNGRSEENQTRSGIAVSSDRIHWELRSWATPKEIDDRDVVLFPEKIGGRFAVLRRPLKFVSPDHNKVLSLDAPGIRISFSADLETWSEPALVINPEQPWEGGRIGAASPPIKTPHGWLMLYHGVETLYPPTKRVCYRLGAAMLDLMDPTRVVARCRHFIMEPETYYERFGLYIPNVIFPTGGVVVNGLLYLYYGACDTAIALATVPLDRLIEHVMQERV